METPGLAEHTRQRLMVLVLGNQPDGARWLERLREIRQLDEVPACSAAVRILTNLDLSEGDAEQLLTEILDHRAAISRALRRDPGLRVAAIDYLANVRRLLTNPKIVEMSEFERTERSAFVDPLTRLRNRRFLQDALEREVRRSRRHRLHLSLALFDVDEFKRVNDDFGHLFGDLVLQRIARGFTRVARETDIVCRFGGEEFVVILPETHRLGAHALAQRIRAKIENIFANETVGGREVRLTVSAGIATYPEDGTDAAKLIARADESLYLAKRGGKNRVILFHSERRGAVRFPVRRGTEARIVGDDGAEQPAKALNLSASGALLETSEPFAISRRVRVRWIREGLLESRDEWVATGRVVRLDAAAPRGACRFGMAFDEPIPESALSRRIVTGSGPRRLSRGGAR